MSDKIIKLTKLLDYKCDKITSPVNIIKLLANKISGLITLIVPCNKIFSLLKKNTNLVKLLQM